MSLRIDGVAIVTGAGSGIGKQCALAFATEGARAIVLADVNHAAAQSTATLCKELANSSPSGNPTLQTLAVALDVTDPASVARMVSVTVEVFGRIDYCVNSAGIGVQRHRPIEAADAGEMERFWQVNVLGTFHCVQAVVGAMKAQESRGPAGRGAILNLGSANSFMATPEIVQYTTAKHAVIGLTKNAALDAAKHDIRINAICPGWVDTPMVSAAVAGNAALPKLMQTAVPMGRIARPEEIADVVMFMVSPRSSYVTGVGWLVDGGLTLQLQTS